MQSIVVRNTFFIKASIANHRNFMGVLDNIDSFPLLTYFQKNSYLKHNFVILTISAFVLKKCLTIRPARILILEYAVRFQSLKNF